MRRLLILLLLVLFPSISWSQVIEVTIKGVDDGVRTKRQQDYNEALMNAKLQAIERAGVEIESITRIVNFQMKFKTVEAKAKAVLMPGFQVVDIGYTSDGTYQVVLVGKVNVGKGISERAEKLKGMIPLDSRYIVTNGTQVYTFPNVGSDVVMTLAKGAVVDARARSLDGWYFVEHSGKEGFVYGRFLEEAESYLKKQRDAIQHARVMDLLEGRDDDLIHECQRLCNNRGDQFRYYEVRRPAPAGRSPPVICRCEGGEVELPMIGNCALRGVGERCRRIIYWPWP